MMQETICQFGPNNSLTGILTQPEQSVRVADAPVALILNAGIVHNIGPFRLHVDIARNLAEAGFTSLRIDLSGLGDSETRTGKSIENRAVLDAADAIDYLAEHQSVGRVVVVGLCSGAFNAHQVALADPRVVGAAFFDGMVFRTTGFYLRHYLRYAKPRFWRNAIKRRWIGEPVAASDGNSLDESEFFEMDKTQGVQVSQEINTLVDRGLRMFFIYTEGFDDVASAGQFEEMFGVRPDDQVQVEYFKETEHTFQLTRNRKMACLRLRDWYSSQFAEVALASK